MNHDPSWPDEATSEADRIERYSRLYSHAVETDFERTLVHYRQRSVLEYLARRRPQTIVEVGCGLNLLALAAMASGLEFSNWTIVEPSAAFTATARQQTTGMSNIEIVEAFFETAALEHVADRTDLVILSGLLHEVDDPGSLLAHAHTLLKPRGRIYVVVPNAASLHRRLAVAMGLIGALNTPSDRNRHLMQRRIFDARSLADLCVEHDFEVVDMGGMFLKPFTNDQMRLCAAHLSSNIMTGLWKLGRDLPELASEIFVEARKVAPSPAMTSVADIEG